MSDCSFPVRFVWDHGGNQVRLSIADIENNQREIELEKTSQGFHEVFIKLRPGRYEYR